MEGPLAWRIQTVRRKAPSRFHWMDATNKHRRRPETQKGAKVHFDPTRNGSSRNSSDPKRQKKRKTSFPFSSPLTSSKSHETCQANELLLFHFPVSVLVQHPTARRTRKTLLQVTAKTSFISENHQRKERAGSNLSLNYLPSKDKLPLRSSLVCQRNLPSQPINCIKSKNLAILEILEKP